MKTVAETRRERLEILIEKHGSVAVLNEALGWARTDPKLAQIRNANVRAGRAKPYQMGDAMARDIEDKLRLERGWMDTPIYNMPSATVFQASDKVFEWYWPFKDIEPRQYREVLEQTDRDAIEATANALFAARRGAAKQSTPENNQAAAA
jgi:hypothetical protein